MASPAIAGARPSSSTAGSHASRTVGLAIGVIVGGAFALLAELVDFGSFVGFPLPWAASTLVTGAFVGWVFGAATGRADQTRAWLSIVVKQALLAVVVGSFTVGTVGASELLVVRTGDLGSIPVAVYYGATTGLLGIVFLGWLIAPIALVASVIWSFGMHVVGRGS